MHVEVKVSFKPKEAFQWANAMARGPKKEAECSGQSQKVGQIIDIHFPVH